MEKENFLKKSEKGTDVFKRMVSFSKIKTNSEFSAFWTKLD